MLNELLVERFQPVIAFAPGTPSSAAPGWINLKDYWRATVLIVADNATTVTGAAIGLLQATDTSGTGSKTLAFTTMYANLDVSAGSSLTKTTVASNTFTTTTVDNKNSLYAIEIKQDMLDIANGFDCFKVTIGNTTAQAVAAVYLLGPKLNAGLN